VRTEGRRGKEQDAAIFKTDAGLCEAKAIAGIVSEEAKIEQKRSKIQVL
jgi:hypothetical protein